MSPRPVQQLPSGQQVGRSVSGPIDRVPCPACGAHNDLRDLHSQQLLDTGSLIECSRCDRQFFVSGMHPVLVVVVRVPTDADRGQRAGRRRSPPPVAAPRTISMGAARRMIRGR